MSDIKLVNYAVKYTQLFYRILWRHFLFRMGGWGGGTGKREEKGNKSEGKHNDKNNIVL